MAVLLGFLALALLALLAEHVIDPGSLPTFRDPRGWAGRHLATERGALAALVAACAWVGVLVCAAVTTWLGLGLEPWQRAVCGLMVPAAVAGAVLGLVHAGAAVSSIRACYRATGRAAYVVALERRDMMIVDMEGASDDQYRGDRGGKIAGLDA